MNEGTFGQEPTSVYRDQKLALKEEIQEYYYKLGPKQEKSVFRKEVKKIL